MSSDTLTNHDRRSSPRESEAMTEVSRFHPDTAAATTAQASLQPPCSPETSSLPTTARLRKTFTRFAASSALRFLLLGCFSFGCNLAIPAILHELFGVKEAVAFAVSLVAVFVANFWASRKIVFPGTHRSVTAQGFMFLLASLGFRSCEYLCFLLLNLCFAIPYLLAIMLTLVASFTVKYLFYKNVVFRPLAP
jgi:putative flippase GtrA